MTMQRALTCLMHGSQLKLWMKNSQISKKCFYTLMRWFSGEAIKQYFTKIQMQTHFSYLSYKIWHEEQIERVPFWYRALCESCRKRRPSYNHITSLNWNTDYSQLLCFLTIFFNIPSILLKTTMESWPRSKRTHVKDTIYSLV